MNKLLEVSIVKRIVYSILLANPVVVPKHNGEWRMCIDYIDLNKAILKKPFPLPQTGQVVDAVVENKVPCFLDAYKSYHQIQMAPENIEKMKFVTDDGIFCY